MWKKNKKGEKRGKKTKIIKGGRKGEGRKKSKLWRNPSDAPRITPEPEELEPEAGHSGPAAAPLRSLLLPQTLVLLHFQSSRF